MEDNKELQTINMETESAETEENTDAMPTEELNKQIHKKVLLMCGGVFICLILIVIGIITGENGNSYKGYTKSTVTITASTLPAVQVDKEVEKSSKNFFDTNIKSGLIEYSSQVNPTGVELFAVPNQTLLGDDNIAIGTTEQAYSVLQGFLESNDIAGLEFVLNEQDTMGSVYRFDQTYKGVLVGGCSFIITEEGLSTEHKLGRITGVYATNLNVDVNPKVTLQQALDKNGIKDEVLFSLLMIDNNNLVWYVETEDAYYEFSAVNGHLMEDSTKSATEEMFLTEEDLKEMGISVK